jgi:hypothetical protein
LLFAYDPSAAEEDGSTWSRERRRISEATEIFLSVGRVIEADQEPMKRAARERRGIW